MKTRIKQGVPVKPRYDITELENEAEIQALIDKTNAMLRPCDKCGSLHAEVFYYYSPSEDEKAPHRFRIQCRCLMQTHFDAARDNAESIMDALDFVFTLWNRSPDNLIPYPPFWRRK
jgi:hypothetical protein